MFGRLSLLIVLAASAALPSRKNNNIVVINSEVEEDVKTVILALRNTLDFILTNHKQANVDCIFGVMFTKVFLEDALSHAGPYEKEILVLKNLTEQIFIKTSNGNNFSKKDIYFLDYMVNEKLWRKKINFNATLDFYTPKRYAASAYYKNYESDFDERKSDLCFIDLIKETKALQPKICSVKSTCMDTLYNDVRGLGYIRTHKLLYLQLAKNRKCTFSPHFYNSMTRWFCSHINWEIESAYDADMLKENVDLMMEQIVLCGYEGFADVLKRNYLKIILELQHDCGCFSVDIEKRGARSKREANYMKNGCIDHTTGLGAASLSLYLDNMLSERTM